MAGTVYLRTNHFEVKLEGITFKTKDFESLCKTNFLFSGEDDDWDRSPIVGIDVMRHPRDPSIVLLFLCFGVGCVILRFGAGEALPAPIHRFLADKRIQFVGFAIPAKRDLFPFKELGLNKKKIDIGYLTAKILRDPKYKRRELPELARRVLGIKRMIGLTDASSFERHEQIKCSICQLFITTLIAMGLNNNDKKKIDYSSRKSSVLKNLNSLQLLAEGWNNAFKNNRKQEAQDRVTEEDVLRHDDVSDDRRDRTAVTSPFNNCFFNGDISQDGDSSSGNSPSLTYNMKRYVGDGTDVLDLSNRGAEVECGNGSGSGMVKDQGSGINTRRPIKGILKCPSTKLRRCNSVATTAATGDALKSSNSKGHNVSFNFV